jgi:hypothetical protein
MTVSLEVDEIRFEMYETRASCQDVDDDGRGKALQIRTLFVLSIVSFLMLSNLREVRCTQWSGNRGIHRSNSFNIYSATARKVGVVRSFILQLFAVQQARLVFFCFGKFSREQLP